MSPLPSLSNSISPSNYLRSPKLIPWFVSDVTPPDFRALVDALGNPAFFPPSKKETAEEAKTHVESMVARWRGYIADGRFKLSVDEATPLGPRGESRSFCSHRALNLMDCFLVGTTEGEVVERAGFWTQPYPCWDMRERASSLWEDLRQSGLVVFKVGLNRYCDVCYS